MSPGEQLWGYLLLCFSNHLLDPVTQLLSCFLGSSLTFQHQLIPRAQLSGTVFLVAEIDPGAGRMSLSNFVLLLSGTLHLQKCSQRQHQPTPTATPTVSFLTDNIANSSPCSSCPLSYRPWMVIYLLNGTRRCQRDNYGARVPSQFQFDETL